MKTLSAFILFLLVSISVSSNNYNLRLPELPKCEKVSEAERKIPEEYRILVVKECLKYSIPLKIFVKHIYRESKYDPNAINYNYKKDPITGEMYLASIDQGIGQQNSLFHSEFVLLDNNGKEYDPMNPYETIPVIAHHLWRMQQITNNWTVTIAGYNCGLSRALTGNYPDITKAHLAYVFGNA
jgi:hypothetical protein